MIGTGILISHPLGQTTFRHLERVKETLFMYDNLLVRKRRRRKIAGFVALFSSLGITSLVIISFLGRSVGTFTVSLNNSQVNLALTEKKNSTNYSTYLRISENAKYIENTYFDLVKKGLDTLDDETTPYTAGEYDYTYLDEKTGEYKTAKGLEYFKYTFYVKNIGNKSASYTMKINIDDRTRADDFSGRSLDDTLRLMVFENDPDSGKHDYRVFAKKAAENNIDLDGNSTDREFIAHPDPTHAVQETEEYRLADKFLDGSTIAEYKVEGFNKNDIKRYTIVIWLEGYDPQSKPAEEYPEGATLKLGVDIAAYEKAQS
jgi:hypothetical protein